MVTSSLLSSLPGIRHGFGSASSLVPPELAPVWDLRPAKRQVHGIRIAAISEPKHEAGDADGFPTTVPGLPVSIITAECVPLRLARRNGSQIAAVHAGWRGLYDGIIPAALAAMGEGLSVQLFSSETRQGQDEAQTVLMGWLGITADTKFANWTPTSEPDYGRNRDGN